MNYVVRGPDGFLLALHPGQEQWTHYLRPSLRLASDPCGGVEPPTTTCVVHAREPACPHGYRVDLRGDDAALLLLAHAVSAAVNRGHDPDAETDA